MSDARQLQELMDRFYVEHGPCCAGCDWWRTSTGVAGECTKSAPVPWAERIAMLGITSHSMPRGAGHVLTTRTHHCGDFKDDFDWSSLPLAYLLKIGGRSLITKETE